MSIFYRVQSGGGAAPTIVSKNITVNGTYNASSDSADGYDPVIVNVPVGTPMDISNMAYYFNRNTTTPVITHVDSETVDIDFTINNASGYEGVTVSLPLNKGLYLCEFDITINTTSVSGSYGWGVYTTYDSTIAESYERPYTNWNPEYNTYVPFEVTTAKQHIKAFIKMISNGTAYICFSLAGIDTSTATVSIENLKVSEV